MTLLDLLSRAAGTATVSRGMTKALAELDKAEQLQARWQSAAQLKQAELNSLEASLGEQVLAAAEAQRDQVASDLSARVESLRAGVMVDRSAAAAAASRVPQAQRAVLVVEADDVRGQLREARRALQQHLSRLTELLAQVRAHDGVDYEPARGADFYVDMEPPKTHGRRAVQLQRVVGEMAVRLHLLEVAVAGHALPDTDVDGMWAIPPGAYGPLLRGDQALVPTHLRSGGGSIKAQSMPADLVAAARLYTDGMALA